MPRVKKNYNDKVLTHLVNTVGKMLTYYREDAGYSQNALSKKSGVAISTINEIENRTVNDIRLSTISTLSKTLGIEPLKMMVGSRLKVSEADKKAFKKAVTVLNDIDKRLT